MGKLADLRSALGADSDEDKLAVAIARQQSEPELDVPLDAGLLANVPADAMREADYRAPSKRIEDWMAGRRHEPVPAFVGAVDPPPQTGERTGICCSGGGIRSAAYNLGALQRMQARGVLQNAAYLSAVSGGSYTTAALAHVARTWPDAAARPPAGERGHDDSDPGLVTPSAPPFFHGSPEEQYLRNRSSYLAPDGAGKLFLGVRLLLGLLWNLLFIEVLVFALATGAAVLLYRTYYPHMVGEDLRNLAVDTPTPAWLIPALLAGCGLFLSLWYMLKGFNTEGRRRFVQAWSIRLLIAGAAVAVVSLLIPVLVVTVRKLGLSTTGTNSMPEDKTGKVGLTGLATVLAGVVAQVLGRVDTTTERTAEAKRARTWFVKLGSAARKTVAWIGGAVAVPLLILLGFLLPVAWAVSSSSDTRPLWACAIASTVFVVLYGWADLTSWSLHPFYKRQLATAFALKRVRGATIQGDDLGQAVERDYTGLPSMAEADVSKNGSPFPTLLVCAAANVSDVGATPPGRSVTSFTFSPGAIGGPLTGAVTTNDYEKALGKRAGRDMSLLTAVAVSGAALSPSMGKETRPALRALMALANIRLGVWLRNPRYVKKDIWHGRPRPLYLLRELLGRSYVNGKYLYVTDGGHYENLGLVELLRRGCTRIYCFDASGGKGFMALGDAIALARSEVQANIRIDVDDLKLDADDNAKAYCARGTIEYASGQTGTLIYCRTALTEKSPLDALAFREVDPLFPHHPTTDQLYTDQKFEAYRILGACAADDAMDEVELPAEPDTADSAALRSAPLGVSAQRAPVPVVHNGDVDGPEATAAGSAGDR